MDLVKYCSWKGAEISLIAGKYKLKPQWASTPHNLEGSKLKTEHISVDKDMEKLETHKLIVICKSIAALKSYLAILSGNSTYRYLSKRKYKYISSKQKCFYQLYS
jgi:hypothetical protein